MEPDDLILPADATPPDLGHASVFFIGTATVLLRFGGFTVLTDPNFLHRGGRVPLGYGLHATRLTNPAIDIDELPPVDLVLLSHMHGDHFDQVASDRLDHTLPIVTTRHAQLVLRHRGFTSAHALKTWQAFGVRKGDVRLRVTAMPGRHGPGVLSAVLPPVNGSMLEFDTGTGAPAVRVYISGDTLVHDALREIPRRFPDIDLGLFHLGGTRVGGLLVTMDGAQGVEAVRMVRPERAIPIHYNDYDRFKSPLDEFKRAVEAAGLEERVHYLSHGDTYEFPVRGVASGLIAPPPGAMNSPQPRGRDVR